MAEDMILRQTLMDYTYHTESPEGVDELLKLIQSEVAKTQEQLLDRVMEMKPLTTVDPLINLWAGRIEAKHEEIKVSARVNS